LEDGLLKSRQRAASPPQSFRQFSSLHHRPSLQNKQCIVGLVMSFHLLPRTLSSRYGCLHVLKLFARHLELIENNKNQISVSKLETIFPCIG
jgi:hypothetical protein